MKKNIIILITSILYSQSSFSQNWQWAKQIGGPQIDGGGIVQDLNGNIFSAGYFENQCYFQNDTLNSLGVNDIFLSKHDASGNEQWSKRIGGNNPISYEEYPGGIVIDNSNNCFYFSGIFYDALTIDTYTVNSIGGLDVFLAKFDLSGNCLWLIRAGSTSDDGAEPITVDASGNVFWVSTLSGSGFINTTSAPIGQFLAKLDNAGNVLTVKPNFTIAASISYITISNNQIIASGVTRNDTTIIDTDTLTSDNIVDGFLAKFDLSGSSLWAKRFGGHTSSDVAGQFAIDQSNNIYLVGAFEDSITFQGDTLSNNNKRDMFFAKFDTNGNFTWAKQINSSGIYDAGAYSIAKDIDGLFYIVGTFSGNASFGSFAISASAMQDMFLARYDSNGDCVGVRHFGYAKSYSVQTDNSGSVSVAGSFASTVNIGSTTLTCYGATDMFIAKSDAITEIGGRESNPNNQLLIYANPNQGKCNITVPDDFVNEKNLKLSIYDNTSKLIQEKVLEMNDGKIKLNLEAEAKGIYNVTLSNKKKSYNGKIIFE